MHHSAVVILNYNTRSLLEELLPKVIEHSPDSHIVLADNASTDGSAEFISGQFPNVQLIKIPSNLGFAGGYNYALKQVQAKYYVLLNSDVETSPNWLNPLINHLENNDNTAAVQPKIKDYYRRDYFEYAGACGGFIDKFGFPFCRGRIFGNIEKDTGQYNSNIPIFWATGAALCIRSKVWEEAGGLDEMFFAHMEEIDLCWRIHNMGHQIYCLPESTVYHMGGGTLSNLNPRKTFLNFRNGLYMLHKNVPQNSRNKIIFIRKALDGLAAILFLFTGKASHVRQIYKAHIAFEKTKHLLVVSDSKLPTSGVLNKSLAKEYFLFGRKVFSSLRIYIIK
jgi:GT2 family glycosyltransferase